MTKQLIEPVYTCPAVAEVFFSNTAWFIILLLTTSTGLLAAVPSIPARNPATKCVVTVSPMTP